MTKWHSPLSANRTGRMASILVAVSLCIAFGPLHAQGIGPPDLGVFNYVIIGVWLFCWLAVLVYPIALVVYLIGRQPEEDENVVAPSRGYTVFKWAIKIHLILTFVGVLLFALD